MYSCRKSRSGPYFLSVKTLKQCTLKIEHPSGREIQQPRTVCDDMRTLPLVPFMRERLLALKEEQQENRRLCGRSYIKDYIDYVCVNEIGDLIKPHYVTESFPKLLKANGLRHIRYHDLRHPYVKHTTKKYNSEKQKTQATKMDLIAWVFRFCIFNYSKRSWIL